MLLIQKPPNNVRHIVEVECNKKQPIKLSCFIVSCLSSVEQNIVIDNQINNKAE